MATKQRVKEVGGEDDSSRVPEPTTRPETEALIESIMDVNSREHILVVARKASRGPFLSSNMLYKTRRAADAGQTQARAKGNAERD